MKARTAAFFLFISGCALFATVYTATYMLLSKFVKPVEFKPSTFAPRVAP